MPSSGDERPETWRLRDPEAKLTTFRGGFRHSSLNLFFTPSSHPRFLRNKNQQFLFFFFFFCYLTWLSESVVAAGSGATAMQSQLVCNGCRSLLLYPRGATNVCCALCNTITSVPPPGMEMSQLYCGGCRTLLMYTRGATSVRCSCCHTVNLVPASNQVAHVHCGNCRTTLMYPYGAPSVKCALCHYITNVSMNNGRLPIPVHRPNGPTNAGTLPSTSTSMPQSQSQTVVVENPMSVDSSGKLVSNVVVGVTTDKK
ncbi:hypothetical protein VNO78_10837 [Psophocarpus tetragonolobus]|uniref:Zinc finger LSD1-type domain-containing protein n=1 Tax=Psophocarpus tetragonolobus TaxID=3891 RepID=A0AAN9SKE5_PSOTE